VIDCVILGGGPAGLTASIYLSRYNIQNKVIAKGFGMVSETPDVENYPGFKSISGLELIQKFTDQAQHFGAEVLYEEVEKISKLEKSFKVKTNMAEHEAKTIVLAMGTHKRELNVSGEKEFKGKGVSYCATCDGAFFKEKSVGVVGGGNSALTVALTLSSFKNKVHLLVRSDFTGDKILIDRVNKDENIIIHKDVVVSEVYGEEMMQGVVLQHRKKDETEKLELDGLFVEVGLIPNTNFVKDFVELNDMGLIVVNEALRTSVPGVFAAGDVTTGSNNMWQIITAAAEGAIAANSVNEYLSRL